MNKQIFFTGFMLFALFFGAGNLIYPPTLGIEAGTSYWPAIIGFIVTGVGLPIIAVVAIAYVSQHSTELGNQVHPNFGLIFTSIIYLAIGPFFGIPRAASVAFEMGITPSLPDTANQELFLLGFTFLFFTFVFWQSLHPSKLVDRIGQWLTPVLVIAIVALSVGGFILLNSETQSPIERYQHSPLFTGFVEGYLTMDAIAALAFGIIVITSFKQQGVTNKKTMVLSTLKAGIVAGIALSLVYGSLGWIGTKMATVGTFENGGQILSDSTDIIFGSYGKILLGIIVLLACLTTSIGLTVACGQYFAKKTRFSYTTIISIVTIVSLLISNLGLNQIIAISVPVLTAIYPIAIVLILLSFFNQPNRVYQYAIILTAIISVYDGILAFGFDLQWSLIELLPFYSLGLGWLIPAIMGAILGKLVSSNA